MRRLRAEQVDDLALVRDRPSVIAQTLVALAHEVRRPDPQRDIAQLFGDAERATAVVHGAIELPEEPAAVASRGRDLSQAAPIAERHGERLGGAHVLVHVHELAECPEAVAETDAKVQVPLEALRCLGQPLEDAQRLFEPLHRVAVGGARGRLDAGATQVVHGFLPELSGERMMGEHVHLLGETLRIEPLDGGGDLGVKRAPPRLQQALVGHVLGECVLEHIFHARKEPGLVDELRRLQAAERLLQDVLVDLRDFPQQRVRDVSADDGRRLQQSLVRLGQPVDTCDEHRAHRGGNLDGRIRTLSSRKNGLPSVRSMSSVFTGVSSGSLPSSTSSSSSAWCCGSGSMRIWVYWLFAPQAWVYSGR